MTNICSFYSTFQGLQLSNCTGVLKCSLLCSCCFPEQSSLVLSGRACSLSFRMCSAKSEGNVLGNHIVFIKRYFRSKLTKGSRGSDFHLPSPSPPLVTCYSSSSLPEHHVLLLIIKYWIDQKILAAVLLK